MQTGPGPNDFHFAPNAQGVMVMKPGLGSDQPSPSKQAQVLADAKRNAEREAALDKAAKALQSEQDDVDAQRAELEAKAAELDAREKRLLALEQSQGLDSATTKRRASATDRTGE